MSRCPPLRPILPLVFLKSDHFYLRRGVPQVQESSGYPPHSSRLLVPVEDPGTL